MDVERWHSLHQLVSLSVQLSRPRFSTGSLWDGDLLLVPQPWFTVVRQAQAWCSTMSPFCPSFPRRGSPSFSRRIGVPLPFSSLLGTGLSCEVEADVRT